MGESSDQFEEVGTSAASTLTRRDRHDLRGIVAAIQAFAELLEDEISGPLNADQKDHVGRILANVDALSRRLDELP